MEARAVATKLPRITVMEGRISGSIREGRLVVGIPFLGVVREGFFVNGQLKVLPRDDPGIPVVKEAAKKRQRIICVFFEEEHLSHLFAVYIEPKGFFRKALYEKLNDMLEGSITPCELVEDTAPRYPP